MIYRGEATNILANYVHDQSARSLDLIYVDPPFVSNRHYEVLWGDGVELQHRDASGAGRGADALSEMPLRNEE